MVKWTASNMPSQKGRSAIVTGTGGLGFETSLALAQAGAEVIIAGRSAKKGAAAADAIQQMAPSANIRFEAVDLASLQSVTDFARRLGDQRDSLDLLINNAGVMTPPRRQETADGFELQLGTNYLGHFALTAHVMPLLRNSPQARVVSVSSIAARGGAINFNDLNAEERYSPMPVYAQSKLACLMFALELQRQSDVKGWGVDSIAAHPGISRTDLLHNAPGRGSVRGMLRSLLWFLFQPASMGSLPTLFAATAPLAKPGGYYGPDGLGETRGYPIPAKIPPLALDKAAAVRLWQVSEALTGARF